MLQWRTFRRIFASWRCTRAAIAPPATERSDDGQPAQLDDLTVEREAVVGGTSPRGTRSGEYPRRPGERSRSRNADGIELRCSRSRGDSAQPVSEMVCRCGIGPWSHRSRASALNRSGTAVPGSAEPSGTGSRPCATTVSPSRSSASSTAALHRPRQEAVDIKPELRSARRVVGKDVVRSRFQARCAMRPRGKCPPKGSCSHLVPERRNIGALRRIELHAQHVLPIEVEAASARTKIGVYPPFVLAQRHSR